MSLNDKQFKTDLENLFTATQSGTGTAEQNREVFINAMVAAVKAYIKSGQIVYTNGLIAGSNVVTGTFNGNIE